VWPAVVLVVLYWAYVLIMARLETGMFAQFMSLLVAIGVLLLLFAVWWLTNRRIRFIDRLSVFVAAVAAGVLAVLTQPASGRFPWLLQSLPWVLTIWAVGLVALRKASGPARRRGLLAAVLLSWGAFALFRVDGLRGDGQPVLRGRWSLTAEERYLAERAKSNGERSVNPLSADSLTLRPGDWPGFRGANREGVATEVRIATDWSTNRPKQLWHRRIGPGWSSAAVVDGRLFTQEQRGSVEAVVCLDADTGREIWAHEDTARFEDGQAGAGPRATPTFADGRVYALGATGILNCLDASTGERKWSHDIAAESDAQRPIWGFSSSPLVIEGMVIVFAGGDGDKGLLAYRADSGEPAWTVAAGQNSYSSPHRVQIDGKEMVLFVGERGLTAIDPVSGAVLWENRITTKKGMGQCLQPHPLGTAQVLVTSESDGIVRIDVERNGQNWASSRRWTSRSLKPTFNDFVVHEQSIYGFDGSIFCCVDAATGRRRWKEGRYGNGQVLLLADQALLLIVSEKGAVVLVAADPEEHKELGRFQGIEGKTWNHPAIAQGRLYVRNGEEMACYELGSIKP
jgi:outer membrane protein assembly factor BamB